MVFISLLSAVLSALIFTSGFSSPSPANSNSNTNLKADERNTLTYPYVSRRELEEVLPPSFLKRLKNIQYDRRPKFRARESAQLGRPIEKFYNRNGTTNEQSTEEVEPQGYTFDPCSMHEHCTGGRYCIRADFAYSCSGAINCICWPHELQLCKMNCTECANYPQESCLYGLNDEENGRDIGICASTFTVYSGILVERGCDSYPGLKPVPIIDPYNNSNINITGSDTDLTTTYSNTSMIPTTQPPQAPPNDTTPSSTNSNSTPSPSQTTYEDEVVSGEPSRSNVCIDVAALSNFDPSQLVYDKHILARVLCDLSDNCATPGHMVVYQNTAMSMRSYCAQALGGCSTAVKHVNSPRYARGLRVRSRTAEFDYTTFAATFESYAEEKLLSFLIHTGL